MGFWLIGVLLSWVRFKHPNLKTGHLLTQIVQLLTALPTTNMPCAQRSRASGFVLW